MYPDLVPVRRIVNTHRPTAGLVLPKVEPGIGEYGDLSAIFVFGDEDVLRAVRRCAVKVAAMVGVGFASPDVRVGLADFVVGHAFHLLALIRIDEDTVLAEDPEVVISGWVILFSVEVEVVHTFQAPRHGIEDVLHLDCLHLYLLGYIDRDGSSHKDHAENNTTHGVGEHSAEEPNHDWRSLAPVANQSSLGEVKFPPTLKAPA